VVDQVVVLADPIQLQAVRSLMLVAVEELTGLAVMVMVKLVGATLAAQALAELPIPVVVGVDVQGAVAPRAVAAEALSSSATRLAPILLLEELLALQVVLQFTAF
jgi:hypothetical protein